MEMEIYKGLATDILNLKKILNSNCFHFLMVTHIMKNKLES